MNVQKDVVELAKKALADELFSYTIYSKLSEIVGKQSLKEKLLKIAKMEQSHADFWSSFLEKRGCSAKVKVNRFKVLLYLIFFKIFGLGLSIRLLEKGEEEAIELYSHMLSSSDLSEDEKNCLKRILEEKLVHEEDFIREESMFEEFLSHVKEAILGMNDGLVEVLSVTTGLAAVYGDPFHVAVGGLIVGIAGALSMAIGAYVSARAQRQIHESILARTKVAVLYVPKVFVNRIVEYFTEKGFSRTTSHAIAEEASRDLKLLSSIVAEEEHGVREESLENPLKAGLYTGLFYILGSVVPFAPYFIGVPVNLAIIFSLTSAAFALAFTGFIIAVSAKLSIRKKIFEMILAGLGSAAVTFAIGRFASIILGIEVS